MMDELSYPLNLVSLQRKKKTIKQRLLEDAEAVRIQKKIAVLGGGTTHDLIEFLELFLLDHGIQPQFYESGYNQYWQDAVFGNEALDAFAPDVVCIYTGYRNILGFPKLNDSEEKVDKCLDEEFHRYQQMWEALRNRYHCTIIQNNFELPPYRLLGNADAYDIHGHTYFVNELNRRICAYARRHDGFYVNDINWLSAELGLEKYYNPKHWLMFKVPADLLLMPYLSMNLAFIIKAIFGHNQKAIAVDLDNTLWGGVIGEDGQEGIKIGSGSGESEAFSAFQEYLLELKATGTLLAVNSKNERENALLGLQHPESVLKAEDFVTICANWNSKDRNLDEIATTLNLGIDSIVFVDDNPAEREIVKTAFPRVAVPQMDKPENYISLLDRNGYFESTGISKEDLIRNDMYLSNAKREAQKQQFADFDKYLESLAMHAVIRRAEKIHYQRIAQLSNKTNQFNLTTRRYSLAEITSICEDPEYICLFGHLKDSFGDNGIVTVMIGHRIERTLEIDLFLMSCRVFQRGMEDAMMNVLADNAARMNVDVIRGTYLPTKKNKIVANLYGKYGFKCVEKMDLGGSVWELAVSHYTPIPCHISVNSVDAD